MEINLTEQEFYDKYTLIPNHLEKDAPFDGCMFETFGEEREYIISKIKTNTVWTIVENEDKLYYTSGFAIVNRLGFLLTEQPYNTGDDIVVILED
jgi:hypothetical protein